MAQTTPGSTQTTPPWASAVRSRRPFYLLVALLLAALAGIATYLYLEDLRQHSIATVEAVVAVGELRPGTVIQSDQVEARGVPPAVLPQGAVVDLGQAIGRVTVNPIAPGEIVLTRDLAGDTGGGLSARLPDGRWAMVLPQGWLVTPLPEVGRGDRLDLIAYQPGQPAESAGVVVEAVEILIAPGSEGGGQVTLAVTRAEAIAIVYSRANGFQLLALLRPRGG